MKNEIVQKLDNSVLTVMGSKNMAGFEKAHVVARAISDLKLLLTDEYMKPIMELQGTKLGFRTDKDKNRDGTKGPGYPMAVVRDCLIEAVLKGLQPTGNQFNIISGSMYETKEGCGTLLNNWEGLKYNIICSLPMINADKTSAAVNAIIDWTLNGEVNQKTVPIPIKMDSYTSVDAIIGKATRKARAWLISRVSGVEITDGEVEDVNHTVMSSGPLQIDVDDLKFQYENKKDNLTAEDQISVERIIKNQEVKSYKKVLDLLNGK